MDFLENKKELWENTQKLETFVGRAKDFDAIFYVGGLGRKYTSSRGNDWKHTDSFF